MSKVDRREFDSVYDFIDAISDLDFVKKNKHLHHDLEIGVGEKFIHFWNIYLVYDHVVNALNLSLVADHVNNDLNMGCMFWMEP